MSKSKKKASDAVTLPNYSKYNYADKLPPFSEHERVPENELSSLVCFHSHQPERKLNQFRDAALNDHLYMTFRKRNLETPKLMRKLIAFFFVDIRKCCSKRHRSILNPRNLPWMNG